MPTDPFSRRKFLVRAGVGATTLLLGGCDDLSQNPTWRNVLFSAENLTYRAQRALQARPTLAREYPETDISPDFRANGSTDPDDADYLKAARNGFADWRLGIDGLVEYPVKLSLADLRGLPSRTQITRHDCVEGWSCIGKWTGARLGALLTRVKLKPNARFLVFHCADTLENSLDGPIKYYESIDLIDAYHPQTILAYEMNDRPLPVAYGAPLRLRVERQLGYKMAKYIMRIEAVETLAPIGDGKGGYWEDRGYEWYAGI
ncbi:MAG TPA: molybdopterin-binding protein [Xanthobacteraceae bacterium]|jgi:DMSO/TMAO reductase YedYZ molybdopterin-dependent catalytic subunit|nr:molybdopterin-binding protein [Xanthobacteraceae bacterium]